MSVTTDAIRLTTTAGGEIRRIAPVTVTTATRFVNCSAGGQKRIGREACGASPIAKVTPVGSKTRAFSKGHSRGAPWCYCLSSQPETDTSWLVRPGTSTRGPEQEVPGRSMRAYAHVCAPGCKTCDAAGYRLA